MIHWATKYIGKAWELGASGPNTYDCWHLVVEIQEKQFDREMPLIRGAATISESLNASKWRMHALSTGTKEGDVLSMQGRDGPHVATVIRVNGMPCVVHAIGSQSAAGSVSITKIEDLGAIGFGRIKVWKYDDKACAL